jgi:hypothetical protein
MMRRESIAQKEFLEALRADSFLNRSVPLGEYNAPWPQVGPSAWEWFGDRIRRNDYGQFWFPPRKQQPK